MDIYWDEDLNGLRVEDGKVAAVKCGLLRVEDQFDMQPGETYFRLISATFIDEADARGQHNLFADVVDENHNRLDGATVWHGWPWAKWPGEDEHVTDKVFGGHLATWGLYADYDANTLEYGPYWTKAEGKSDVFYGMGLPWNRHVSFSVVFQRLQFGQENGDPGSGDDPGAGDDPGSGSGGPDLAPVLARLDDLDTQIHNLTTEVHAIRAALRRIGQALN